MAELSNEYYPRDASLHQLTHRPRSNLGTQLYSNVKKFLPSICFAPVSSKRKKISESHFLDPKESIWVLPITKKYIMSESNWGSRWWRNWIKKKRDSSCKISNETVAGIEISFKEKDIKYLEFLFVFFQ